MTALQGWESFYVIVGSSAGALIGLQFVVITLIADLPVAEGGAQASSAFATPTIVHFCLALLLSALLNAPWKGAAAVSTAWGVVGFAGVVYVLIVTRRMRLQTSYQPEFEDWLCYVFLPFLAYAALAASALAAPSHLRPALFAVAAGTLLLLFIGIHNAWDAVTYHVFVQRSQRREQERLPAERLE